MSENQIRWGILGSGSIAKKFTGDLPYVKGAGAHAVCSRNPANARRFAEEYQIPKVYDTYMEMVQDPEIDIVYVASPHPMHHEHVMACLKAGKAVLCEKPFMINAAEAEEAIRYAGEQRIFLMEAMWTRYLPPIRKVKEWLKSGRIGEVKMIQADFGFHAGWNPEGRLLNPALGGGALLDAGIYPLSFASMVYGEPPKRIMSSADIGTTGVDESSALLLDYGDGRTAVLRSAVRLKMRNDALIYGTKGDIRVPEFLWTDTAVLRVHGAEEETFTARRKPLGYNHEAEEAGRCLREGLTESPEMPLGETLELMKTMDAVRGQWGLRYPTE